MRWLHEFNFELEHVPGKIDMVVDALSFSVRLYKQGIPTRIIDLIK